MFTLFALLALFKALTQRAHELLIRHFGEPSLEDEVTHHTQDSFQALLRKYSTVVVAITLLGVALTLASPTAHAVVVGDKLASYVVVAVSQHGTQVGSWHVTRLLAAFIVWFHFFYAARLRRKMAAGRSVDDCAAKSIFAATELLKRTCTAWNLVCGAYVLAGVLAGLNLIPVPWLLG